MERKRNNRNTQNMNKGEQPQMHKGRVGETKKEHKIRQEASQHKNHSPYEKK